jgi:uncharacterized RDD family membrane protein YckC
MIEVHTTQEEQHMKPIEAPGNIYAEFPERLIAWFIDIMIVLAISRSVSWFVPWINPLAFFDLISSTLAFVIDFLIGFLYFWLLEVFNKGQTFGKMALNLRTVDEKSFQLTTPTNYAINNISKSTAFLLLDVIIGVLMNSGERKNRLRLTQNISKTVVVKDRKK